MKKISLIFTALLSALTTLTACSPTAPKTAKPVIQLPSANLVPAGFLIIEPASQRFVDLNGVRKEPDSPYLIYFDVVKNLSQGAYVYPDSENKYAQSMRRTHLLNCQSQEVVQLSETYYADYWGEGEASPTKQVRNSVVKAYTETPVHLLGKLLCAELYIDKHQKVRP